MIEYFLGLLHGGTIINCFYLMYIEHQKQKNKQIDVSFLNTNNPKNLICVNFDGANYWFSPKDAIKFNKLLAKQILNISKHV